MNYDKIKAKAKLRLPLTAKERTIYILFIASQKEVIEYLEYEKQSCYCQR